MPAINIETMYPEVFADVFISIFHILSFKIKNFVSKTTALVNWTNRLHISRYNAILQACLVIDLK